MKFFSMTLLIGTRQSLTTTKKGSSVIKKIALFFGVFFLLGGWPFSGAVAQTPGWEEIIFKDDPATRFVSGIWYKDRVYAGTHNPGSVYVFGLDPLGSDVKRAFFPDKQAPTEAVLDLIAFRNELFGVVEKSPSEIRRLNWENGTWDPVDIPSREGFYFGAVFRGNLFISGGVPKHDGMTIFRSKDGRSFVQVAHLSDWVWVPAVYQDHLYFLGHKGSAYSKGGTAAFRTNNGSRFERVPSLEGKFQYQCAYPWKGHLYLGIGGWTTARGAKNQAQIYRFDGKRREQVLVDIQMNGITSLAACGRYLYALADSGWESREGVSTLYRTADGKDWEIVRSFPHPEMRKIEIVAGKHILLLGGKNREYAAAYLHKNFCE
ncbi:MAG: hypothetical protein HY892_14900 [Deltaproteobacteria bacterium]|nr:hypothetical protein [Deltaproteobacteria bacterium]